MRPPCLERCHPRPRLGGTARPTWCSSQELHAQRAVFCRLQDPCRYLGVRTEVDGHMAWRRYRTTHGTVRPDRSLWQFRSIDGICLPSEDWLRTFWSRIWVRKCIPEGQLIWTTSDVRWARTALPPNHVRDVLRGSYSAGRVYPRLIW